MLPECSVHCSLTRNYYARCMLISEIFGEESESRGAIGGAFEYLLAYRYGSARFPGSSGPIPRVQPAFVRERTESGVR
jgi:hypothetical protein